MHRSQSPQQRNHQIHGYIYAFTLNELLVTVAIIALLASLLLPTLEAARNMAQTVSCTSRLRQVGLMHTMYSNNNGDHIISAVQDNSVGHWINYFFVETDLNYQEAYQCPSLPRSAYFNPYGGDGKYDVQIYGSYIMNTIKAGEWERADISSADISWGWTRGVQGGYTRPIRLFQVQSPSNTIFLTETPDTLSVISPGGLTTLAGMHINRYLQTDHGPPIVDNSSARRRRVADHHDDGFNVLMGDGRVVNMKSSDASQWIAWTE